jgi:ubiquinone biosynthesis accessory factor UbiJ
MESRGQMSFAALLAPLMEAAINGYLRLDPNARQVLAGQKDARIGIEATSPVLCFSILISEDTITVEPDCALPADAWIRGNAAAIAGLIVRGQTGPGVTIEGDADLAARFSTALKSVDIDWEEWISRVAGDAVAHRAGETARAFNAWLKGAGESLTADVSEYLTEESRALPTRIEVEAFMDQVDALSSGIDRLEARLEPPAKPRADRRKSGSLPATTAARG